MGMVNKKGNQIQLDPRFKEVISNLKNKGNGKYKDIINKIENYVFLGKNPERSFVFEALFANILISNEIFPSYEKKINPDNDQSVDFVYKEADDLICFELLSPRRSEELEKHIKATTTNIEGISIYEEHLTSNHENEHIRPEAQQIRMQDKLFEKVNKFPRHSCNNFSVIVVDCGNFQSGMYDDDDCRMVMYGKTREPLNQQYWEGTSIFGILDDSNNKRGAKEFRDRVTAVIFIPEFPSNPLDLLNNAFIVPNLYREKEHLENLEKLLKKHAVFMSLRPVHPSRHLRQE